MEVGAQTITSSLSAPPPSSSQSFHSARINGSSPRQPDASASPPDYRAAKTLPYELREHCMIYFEEGLCMASLPFMQANTNVSPRSSSSGPSQVTSHFWDYRSHSIACDNSTTADHCLDIHIGRSPHSNHKGKDIRPNTSRKCFTSISTTHS